MVAELPVVHLRVIAADHAGLFHLFNAGGGGRGRKEYLSCDILDGSPPVFQKYFYYFLIYRVQLHGMALPFCLNFLFRRRRNASVPGLSFSLLFSCILIFKHDYILNIRNN